MPPVDNPAAHTTRVWTALRVPGLTTLQPAYGLTRFACRTTFLKIPLKPGHPNPSRLIDR